jgi:hypothetical protein
MTNMGEKIPCSVIDSSGFTCLLISIAIPEEQVKQENGSKNISISDSTYRQNIIGNHHDCDNVSHSMLNNIPAATWT